MELPVDVAALVAGNHAERCVVRNSSSSVSGSVSAAEKGLTKKCRVCGDKALAFNFNGLSCESCKAFFRRNALRQSSKILFCLQGGSCDIDITTRKFCPRCRLDKCFSIGMRKELVMAREEKLKKRQRGFSSGGNGKARGAGTGSEKQLINSPSNSFDSLNLGAFEVACIGEVKRAGRVFQSNPVEQAENHATTTIRNCENNSVIGSSSNLLQALSLQETYIRKIIDFCKSLASSFACLKPADQMVMVKNFFEDSLTIRCAFHYDYLQDGFPVMNHQQQQNFSPEIKTEFEQNGNGSPHQVPVVKLPVIFPASKQHHLETYRKFIYALHNELEGDRNIRDLLITISLFKYTDDVSCPEFVRYNHVLFCRLLHRYLESKYQDGERANAKFDSLMGFSERMWAIKELICETYVDMDVAVAATVLDGIYHFSRAEVF
ncbi:hypothetical protein TYRP_011503 [Tyrophagus putrescentiae]|nr:hypothetical protein TYRP_011503 [Tyrophagus putrescentiae]